MLVPWRSNHAVVDWVARGYFEAYLRAGIHIFSYRGAMLHANTCTIDGRWTTIGSADLDRLSGVGNYEINAEAYSARLAQQMAAIFACDQSDAVELTLADWVRRPWMTRVSERVLAPLRLVL